MHDYLLGEFDIFFVNGEIKVNVEVVNVIMDNNKRPLYLMTRPGKIISWDHIWYMHHVDRRRSDG